MSLSRVLGGGGRGRGTWLGHDLGSQWPHSLFGKTDLKVFIFIWGSLVNKRVLRKHRGGSVILTGKTRESWKKRRYTYNSSDLEFYVHWERVHERAFQAADILWLAIKKWFRQTVGFVGGCQEQKPKSEQKELSVSIWIRDGSYQGKRKIKGNRVPPSPTSLLVLEMRFDSSVTCENIIYCF